MQKNGGLVLMLGAMGMLVACGGGARGTDSMDGLVAPLTLEPPPIYALIGFRSELELSSEQVAALDSIARHVQDLNRPLLAQLDTLGEREVRRSAVIRITPETEPIIEELQANRTRAAEGVTELLSEPQREEVCTLFDRTDARSVNRGQMGAGASGSARWPWCSDGDAGNGEE